MAGRQLKQYAVEVLERIKRGHEERRYYFGMYLPGFNKKDAEEVGLETLAGMTFEEIESCCIRHDEKPWELMMQKPTGNIGWDLACKYFSCRAYIER